MEMAIIKSPNLMVNNKQLKTDNQVQIVLDDIIPNVTTICILL